jgi:hypothetical protein
VVWVVWVMQVMQVVWVMQVAMIQNYSLPAPAVVVDPFCIDLHFSSLPSLLIMPEVDGPDLL